MKTSRTQICLRIPQTMLASIEAGPRGRTAAVGRARAAHCGRSPTARQAAEKGAETKVKLTIWAKHELELTGQQILLLDAGARVHWEFDDTTPMASTEILFHGDRDGTLLLPDDWVVWDDYELGCEDLTRDGLVRFLEEKERGQ